MVAGSRTGNSGGFGDGAVCPFPAVDVWERRGPRSFGLARLGDWPALAALYLLAVGALLLPWPFGAHPGWAANWEGYTAWRWATYWEPPSGPALAILEPTDGLMLDGGQGPLVGLPVALGMALAGVGIDAMRTPVALVAAAAAPLLWLFGRRLVGSWPAMLAALLLATSPVFLFYGRTATLAGVSLVPLLVTAIALARVLDAPPDAGWRWRREGALAATLLLGIYVYAPVRLVWPLAVAMLGFAALRNRVRRVVLVRAALLCALAAPVATMALEQLAAPEPDPRRAALDYFHARGEHLVAMSDAATGVAAYLRQAPVAEAGAWAMARQLIAQNASDLARLAVDRETRPVTTDYWNARGRVWPWFFGPLACVGAIATVGAGLRGGRIVLLLPLALAAGLALPLLLTSLVHAGRLLPAVPFALLLAATGVWGVAGWLAERARAVGAEDAARWIAPWLAGMLLAPAAMLARADLETPMAPSREALTMTTLASWHGEARERGSAVLVESPALGDDLEHVRAATYRLDLDRRYRFVDIQRERAHIVDARPLLLWHGTLGALQADAIDHPCGRFWFVAPEVASEFLAAWRGAGCLGAPDSVILP